ncbi:unnamed protein product [Discula destructiva]
MQPALTPPLIPGRNELIKAPLHGVGSAIYPFSEDSRDSEAWPLSPDSSNDSHDSHHGSSPEAEAATPSYKPAKPRRTPSRYDWSKHMPTIKRLYINEDKTLKEVLEIMQREHNFIATPRMVKTRLKKWGYSKNVSVKSEEIESLMELIFDAESQGDIRRASTEVTLATGRVVGLDRVAAHLRRKRIPANVVQKLSQVSVARYQGGASPSPTSLTMDSPFRLPEVMFYDVRSYVYGGFKRPDAVEMVHSGPARERGEIVDLVSSARNFFAQNKEAEALALLGKAPDRLRELMESDHLSIPRHFFMILIHLLNIPDSQRLGGLIKSLIRYVADLASENASRWPDNHPLRRILSSLGQADEESLLEILIRGYKCLLLSYESLPEEMVRGSTTPAWLDLGEAAGSKALDFKYLEVSLWKAYQAHSATLEADQPRPFQQLFWMAELERQKVRTFGLPTDRLKGLLQMTLQACDGVELASAANASLNCHYYLAGIYYQEGGRGWAETHMSLAIEGCKQLNLDAGAARLMGELQGWHQEWGDDDKVVAMQEEIVSKMSDLGLSIGTK